MYIRVTAGFILLIIARTPTHNNTRKVRPPSPVEEGRRLFSCYYFATYFSLYCPVLENCRKNSLREKTYFLRVTVNDRIYVIFIRRRGARKCYGDAVFFESVFRIPFVAFRSGNEPTIILRSPSGLYVQSITSFRRIRINYRG